jgi:hypothetical protein
MMADPSKGALVSFDSGLLASPPPGLEFGYVPIVVQQFMAPGSTAVTTPKPTTTTVVTPEPTPTPVAMPEPTATTMSKPLVVVTVLVALLLVVALGLRARKSKKTKPL